MTSFLGLPWLTIIYSVGLGTLTDLKVKRWMGYKVMVNTMARRAAESETYEAMPATLTHEGWLLGQIARWYIALVKLGLGCYGRLGWLQHS